MFKVCSKCGENKPLANYQVNRQCRGGKRPECKICMKIYAREWRKKNLERSTIKKKEYYEKNKERIQEQHREYIARNKEVVFERHRRYRKNNKEKISAWFTKTPRAAINKSLKLAYKRRPNFKNITLDEAIKIYELQQGKCALTGIVMTWRQGRVLPTSISFDRIDSNSDYVQNNVRFVCHAVNSFRGRMSDAEMLVMAKAIVNYMDREPSWNSYSSFADESDFMTMQ